MATLNITPVLPGDQTGVSVATKLDGYTVTWDPQALGESVEIWQNRANDRDLAVLVATVTDSYYDSPTRGVGLTYHIWTRRKSQFGVLGNWDYGVTAGQVVIVEGVKTSNTAVGIASSLSVVTASSASTTAPSTYNTWTDTGSYLEFIAPSGSARISGSILLVVSASSIANTTGSPSGFVRSRVRVRNMTTSADVPSLTQYHTHTAISSSGTSIFTSTSEMRTVDIKLNSGFGDAGLIPGDTYRFIVDTIKEREASTLTFNVSVSRVIVSDATEDSASVS